MLAMSSIAARKPRRPVQGFTLIEVLVVVVLLGILAAMVIPQFVSATEETRENSVKMNLHRIRTQIDIYQQQHDGRWPTLANFEAQMTQMSNIEGLTGGTRATGYKLGPYLMELPKNTRTSGATVGDGAVGSSDWYYDETTGLFRANDSEESATW
jgi:general secretion pathway protein G